LTHSARPFGNPGAGRGSSRDHLVPAIFLDFLDESLGQAFLLQASGLGLLQIKPQLAKLGRLGGIDSGLQIGLFHKVAPARAAVFLSLAPFEIVEGSLRVCGSFDDGHNSTGYVGLLVEPNDHKRMFRVVCHYSDFLVGRFGRASSSSSNGERLNLLTTDERSYPKNSSPPKYFSREIS
jgi:hypothetical protein